MEQLHESFYKKHLSFISFFASNKKLTIHQKAQLAFSFLFMIKSQLKVDIKLSKICQAIKNLASDKRSLHASLKLFTNSRKCRHRFKLFVDLLDSLQKGTSGQLNIYDTCWHCKQCLGLLTLLVWWKIHGLTQGSFYIYLDELRGNELVFAFSRVSSNKI